MTDGFRGKPRDPDRRAWNARRAAKELGVSTDMITRYVRAGALDGFAEPGKSGQPVAFVYADQVETLKRRMMTGHVAT